MIDFESGQDGATAIGPDAFDRLPTRSSITNFSTELASSGAQSAKLTVLSGTEVFGGVKDFPARLGPGDELRISFRVYWPQGFDWTAGPLLKFFRVHTRSDAVENEGYLDWYINNPEKASHPPFQIIKEIHSSWLLFGTDQDDPVHGIWETYEAQYVFDHVPAAQGGKGRVRAWKNGRLLLDEDDIQTLAGPDSYAHEFRFDYWNGNAPRTQSWYVDDLRLTASIAQDPDDDPVPPVPPVVTLGTPGQPYLIGP